MNECFVFAAHVSSFLNSHNSQQCFQSTTLCMLPYINPCCTLLFSICFTQWRWLLTNSTWGYSVCPDIFSWLNMLKKWQSWGNDYSTISFRPGHPAHICNQSVIVGGAACTRVWSHMNIFTLFCHFAARDGWSGSAFLKKYSCGWWTWLRGVVETTLVLCV